jgi:hypothetical protein
VVVLFAEKVTTLHVMEAARRLGVGTRFVWIGSDAWSSSNQSNLLNPDRRKTEEVVLEGALAVQPLSRQMPGFDEYFTGLNVSHEAVNPWFREFWAEYHQCYFKKDYNKVRPLHFSYPLFTRTFVTVIGITNSPRTMQYNPFFFSNIPSKETRRLKRIEKA